MTDTENSLHTIFLLNYFNITRKTRINSHKLGQKLPAARHFDILCTFAVTWHAINQNKEFVLWSSPAFISSPSMNSGSKCIWTPYFFLTATSFSYCFSEKIISIDNISHVSRGAWAQWDLDRGSCDVIKGNGSKYSRDVWLGFERISKYI